MKSWGDANFPDHSIFNGLNDDLCARTAESRRGCLHQLSILAQAASEGREFLITSAQANDRFEVVTELGGPVLGSKDLLLVTYSPSGLAELRALEVDDPVEMRRRMNHEAALHAALAQTDALPNIAFNDVRDRLLARSELHPRQIAANHVVHLFAAQDPYLRLYKPFTDATVSLVNLQLRPDGERLLLARVDPQTNLDRAGLGIGDLLRKVNGIEVTPKNLDEVFARVSRTEPLHLDVRKIDGSVVDVELKQQEETWDVVKAFVVNVNGGRVGVIAIETFADTRICALVDARLRAFAADRIDALVYDLRGNPGGYAEQAKCVLGLNLGPGRTVARVNLLKGTPTYEYQLKGSVTDSADLVTDRARVSPAVPVVTLIDARTASASEITTASMQEQEYSWVVGDRSYGKSIGQDVLPLLPGHDVLSWKTTVRFDRLDGTSLQGRGVVPDFEVPSALAPPPNDYEPARFAEEHGEAFTTPGRSVRRSPARRAAHQSIRRCVPHTELHVDETTARWLRDRQLAGAVAVGLCARATSDTAGLR